MSKKKATSISLPMSRTMKIMMSAIGVEYVCQDAAAIVTKATEIFLTDFARRAYELSDSNVIDYDDITNLVHSDPRYDFIIDTTPKRIKFSEAVKLVQMARKRGIPLDEEADDELEPPESKPPEPEPGPKPEPEPESEPEVAATTTTTTTPETKEEEEEEEERVGED